MAEKVTARKRKKKGDDADSEPGVGHNFKVDRKLTKTAVDAISELFDKKDTANGAWMSKIKDAYEKFANDLGCDKSNLRELVAEHRREMKRQAKEREMEEWKRDELDKLKLALASYVSTPLGKAAVEKAERDEAASELAED